MDFLGVIKSGPELPPLERTAWVALIPTHAGLFLVPPKQGTNPFTREPMMFFAGADTAHIVQAGKPIGKMDWSPDGSDSIAVWSADAGSIEAIGGIATDVAARLGAIYVRQQE
ncbi:MAG: hypothetical protein ABI821_07660 [Pseudomonadota bacterium]